MIIPFYNEGYLVVLVYLGFLGGANHAFSKLRPLLKHYEQDIDQGLQQAREKADQGLQQAREKAEEMAARAQGALKTD